METEHKSSTSIMRLSISSIKQRLLGIRTSAVPELLKFLNFSFILNHKKTLMN